MEFMGANEIRRKFLEYFESKDHLVKNSYSLVPHNDKTLLLINAGMAPIKNYFLGVEEPPKKKMATCQKCVRTGDIENVGMTARHATFFEMLGNFSFGDYFKREAINFSWEFITKVLNLPEDKLWVTVYLEDDEAYNIWHDEIGIFEERLVRLGKEDNFWEIGTGTGPCGPCSEIYIDRGEEFGGPDEKQPGDEGDRFLEFWNLVFTQFDKQPDGSLKPLEHPNIDTGMGLERISCIMQNVDSIFDIDSMKKIRDMVSEMAGTEYGKDEKSDISIRIITDHVRAATFLVSDGVVPTNEGRGYVLRRLARRALRHAKLLGIKGEIFEKLINTVIDAYKEGYDDLKKNRANILKILGVEEERFSKTLDNGMGILQGYIEDARAKGKVRLDGENAFKLYDTYGFPVELTEEIALENGLKIDMDEFEKHMEHQRQLARSARTSEEGDGWKDDYSGIEFGTGATHFLGYDNLEAIEKVVSIIKDGKNVDILKSGEEGVLIFERTPFYAESGGQVADLGLIFNDSSSSEVTDIKKTPMGIFLHHVKVTQGEMQIGDDMQLKVDNNLRLDAARNHSATHLLHKSLKKVLGDHVGQEGSLVDRQRLRFDFSHFEPISKEQLKEIEDMVNENIYDAHEVETDIMGINDAKETGAMALFDEKYADEVRVVKMGNFSKELCGGTHVLNTGIIGIFKITSEGGVASGIRRIEAVTGRSAHELFKNQDMLIENISKELKTSKNELSEKISQLVSDNKELQKALKSNLSQSVKGELEQIKKGGVSINGTNLYKYKFKDLDMDALKDLAQDIIDSDSNAAILFSMEDSETGKANFLSVLSKDVQENGFKAGDIIREVTAAAGGKGGGKPSMAQGAVPDTSKLDEAFKKFEELF